LSVLTKLFVVLLVVSSLLLSASVVVFVNRVEDYRKQADTQKTNLNAKVREANDAASALADQRTQYQQLQGQMTTETGRLQQDLVAKDGEIQKRDADIARLNKDAQVAAATIKGTQDLARAAQEENKALQGLVADIRTKNDDLLKQNGELNTALTKSDNDNRALGKQVELLQERLVEANNGRGSGTSGAAAPAGSGGAVAPAADIKAVVRSVDVIGGKKYATISVGSSDNVTKGMKFNVINRNSGEFLGYLTIDSVQPNEAIGQLEGKVDKVQPGVEVRTQL
jgi:uncharacterized phage infection (PIP) family protein YhgE